MAITINVNGESISYPETGDTNWSDEATDFAVQTASAFGKVGLSNGTTVDLPGTLDVTGATTLDSTLTVAGTTTLNGTANLNGNTNLGNGSSDTIAVTGILNANSGVLYVDPTNSRVGINDTTPSQALDVTGNVAITGNETVGGTLNVTGATTLSNTLGVTGDVTTSVIKASGSGGLTIDSNGGTDVALFGAGGGSGTTLYGGLNGTTATFSGVIYADDDTTANTPVISFTGDTNTGIGRSAADTIDVITGGVSRAKLNSTGQQSSVIPDLSGSNTTLYNEFKCRAWINFDGSLSTPITPRAGGNVTSVTKNGTGDYTINFTELPDVNYCIIVNGTTDVGAAASPQWSGLRASSGTVTLKSTTQARIVSNNASVSYVDCKEMSVGIFR